MKNKMVKDKNQTKKKRKRLKKKSRSHCLPILYDTRCHVIKTEFNTLSFNGHLMTSIL